MSKRNFLLSLTTIFTVFIVVACSNQGDAKEEAQNNGKETSQSEENEDVEMSQDSEEESQSDVAEEQPVEETGSGIHDEPDSNGDNESTEESSNSAGNASSGDNQLPETIEINEEVRDAGVTFTLEDISFKEDHISVSFHATNTRGHSVSLAADGRAKGDDLGGITLIDDTGYEYRYIAEPPDHRIKLMDGEEVTGTVSFAGRIQDDAKSLTLIFNPGKTGDREPEFAFENIEMTR